MGKRGVINIINNRTGKVYTASSNKDIDKLIAKYKSDLKKGKHHNSELNRDARNGDTFRYQVVSKNCKSEQEVRSLRKAQIEKNRNKYNKVDNVSFEGGNPNSKYYGRKNRGLNNIRQSSYHNSKKRNKSYSKNPRYYGNNRQYNPQLNNEHNWIICPNCGKSNHIVYAKTYKKCFNCKTSLLVDNHLKNPRYYGDGASTTKYPHFKQSPDSLTEKQKEVMRKHFEAIKSQNSKKSQPPKKPIRKSKYYNKNKTKQPEGHLKNPRYYGNNRKSSHPVNNVFNISGGDDDWVKCPKCGTLNHILWIKDNEKCYKCSNKIKFEDILTLKKQVANENVSDFNDKKTKEERINLNDGKIKIPIISADDEKNKKTNKKEIKTKKVCPNCKKEIDYSDNFCIYCGTKIN